MALNLFELKALHVAKLRCDFRERDRDKVARQPCRDRHRAEDQGSETYRKAPHRLLDPDAGPLIAVRLNILTRKTLGGLQTDLDSRVLGSNGQPVQGLYAAGEVAGFGGGGMHGYAALEGTFLGGCIFSGRTAGRAAARSVA